MPCRPIWSIGAMVWPWSAVWCGGKEVLPGRTVPRPPRMSLARTASTLPVEGDYLSEICPAASALVASLAECLEQGLLLFIDYGFPRAEYYHPQRHMGTLARALPPSQPGRSLFPARSRGYHHPRRFQRRGAGRHECRPGTARLHQPGPFPHGCGPARPHAGNGTHDARILARRFRCPEVVAADRDGRIVQGHRPGKRGIPEGLPGFRRGDDRRGAL
jgi:hypothetical protein